MSSHPPMGKPEASSLNPLDPLWSGMCRQSAYEGRSLSTRPTSRLQPKQPEARPAAMCHGLPGAGQVPLTPDEVIAPELLTRIRNLSDRRHDDRFTEDAQIDLLIG